MSQTVVLRVGMSCQGCVGAVNRVLAKMEGVDSFDIDIKEQKVTVIGNLDPQAVFQTVSKTGKKTAFWETEPVPAPEKEMVAVAPPAPLVEAPPPVEAEAEAEAQAETEAKPAEAEAKPVQPVDAP